MLEEDFFKQEFTGCGGIILEIWKLEDNCPDKRTKEYEEWKKKINFLYESYNKISNFGAFKTIK